MNVAQRSASVTGLGGATGYFTVDRWQINVGSTSAGRFTMTQTADGPNGISANCIKLDCTTADTSIAAGERLSLGHNIEGQNLQRIGKGVAGAKQITVSFYVKASAAFTFGVELYDQDAGRQITKLFDTTTDWVRHEFTLPADLDDGSSPFDDDNAAGLGMFFWLHAGSSFTSGTLNTASFADDGTSTRAAGIDSFFSNTANNFFLTGVQLEVGIATEFEQELISTTLQKCQRYFYRHGGAVGEAIGDMLPTNASAGAITVLNPVELRADPSVTILNLTVHDTATVHAVTAIQIRNDLSANRRFMYFVTTVGGGGMTGFRPMVAAIDGSSAGYLELDAEL
tara:strand:- start:178 stop:1197 length:1020 start_codon:yes stop_codon:yes gene_type:complete